LPLRQDMGGWSGRVDGIDGAQGRRWHQVVAPAGAQGTEPGTVLLGFACDAGVVRNQGRAGAAEGPSALRRALANLAWHGRPGDRLYDAGDVTCEGGELEAAQLEYAAAVQRLIEAGHTPIGLGGGHEIAWAGYQGIARALAGQPRLARLGVLNIDAHLDLRSPVEPGRGTSGTPFLQIAQARATAGLEFRYFCLGASEAANTPALLERAASLGVEVVLDVEAESASVESRLRTFIAGSSALYLTVCLDVLPASVAPGVSAPAALGVAPQRVMALLRTALEACGHRTPQGKLLLADVAELNPACDPDGRTARTAARIVYELAGFSRSRPVR